MRRMTDCDEALMSARIRGAVLALAFLGAAVGPADFVRADDKAAAPARASAAKTPDRAEKDEFRAIKREVQARLRNKSSSERIAALRQLHYYPSVDTVKLLINPGLRDDEPSVRDAAYHALLDFTDNAEIARYLLATVNKDARNGAVNQTTFRLLAVLLTATSPDIDRDVSTYLEKQARTHDGLILVESFVDDLGEHGRVEDVGPLGKLMALEVFSTEFGLRRAIAEALMRIRAPQAIGQLVALLEKVQGEIRAEVVKYLSEATGQDLGLDAEAWRAWWKHNEKTFQMPAAAGQRKDANSFALGGPIRGGSMYYGLSIYAQKMVFIIDTSASMLQGGRLIAAKRELLQAIDGLSDDAQFSVLAFNGEVYPWHNQLMPANETTKQAASLWIGMLETANSTASYDALEAGLRFDAEAIYFLTDGVPQGGNVNNPADIVTLITRANCAKRMSIYTIGIGVIGPQGGIFDQFLTALARHNWGIYRRVDK
jgi:hypothetical protein